MWQKAEEVEENEECHNENPRQDCVEGNGK
jgi:hypothetical protein